MRRPFHELYGYRLHLGRIDRFWRGEVRGDVATITEGDVKNPRAAEKRSWREHNAGMRLIKELVKIGDRGYVSMSEKDLKALLRQYRNTPQKVARPGTAPRNTVRRLTRAIPRPKP